MDVDKFQQEYVRPYTWESLTRLIEEFTDTSAPDLQKKYHYAYFKYYLSHPNINVKTIVIESDYVDRDFLEDFAAYYVRCFEHYRRRCLRVLIFSCEFNQTDFEQLVSGDESGKLTTDILKDHYQGFIVLKPLPKQFIGRTCIRPIHSPKVKTRSESTTLVEREYWSHLYGLKLPINSVAFQEQDRVAAACATSAIWSALQGTSISFCHSIPSPILITKEACRFIPAPDRSLPNTGLSVAQMLNSLKAIAIDPLLVELVPPSARITGDPKDIALSADKMEVLTSTVSAYLPMGIPLILGCHMGHKDKGHAMAIVGFETADDGPNTGFSYSRINKLFVHDDQVGPYAELSVRANGTLESDFWGEEYLPVGPSWVIVPLYHKIRIGFSVIEAVTSEFNGYCRKLFIDEANPVGLEWNIRLATVATINDWLRTKASEIDTERRLSFLKTPKPRFMWWCSGRTKSKEKIELFFDATDIQNGRIFIHLLTHGEKVVNDLLRIASEPWDRSLLKHSRIIWDWLEQHHRI